MADHPVDLNDITINEEVEYHIGSVTISQPLFYAIVGFIGLLIMFISFSLYIYFHDHESSQKYPKGYIKGKVVTTEAEVMIDMNGFDDIEGGKE
eukprot:CAMPEP_0201583492 /NCGR_PEP_ID=MMETSP0190_2-20130828/99040_1 /ASSEMBLY_ACC=CAM_ASM_000263 /TAXON_ID=37353 /ORGANISM="Rosalina sp." /LENGTH=93 /DNA_ID=CAMNT_0048025455 /DNA_START=29 /DNA_END=310 /DNA_ORIENTATION=-